MLLKSDGLSGRSGLCLVCCLGKPDLCLIYRPRLSSRGLGCMPAPPTGERVAAKKQNNKEENGTVGGFRPGVGCSLGIGQQ